MKDRLFMAQLCSYISPLSFNRGEGAFFRASDAINGAVHSEPPIHEERVFFSMVPCDESDLASMEERILATYSR